MDVIKAVETYINRMVEEPATMKVLLLDSDTTPFVSLVTTQSTLLSHQIYLTDRIDNRKRDRLPHLKCICFLRPTQNSLDSLAEELHEPHYGEYYLCQSVFSSCAR
jgi:Sec1 family